MSQFNKLSLCIVHSTILETYSVNIIRQKKVAQHRKLNKNQFVKLAFHQIECNNKQPVKYQNRIASDRSAINQAYV